MSWIFLLTGLFGLALGCVFRLPALLAALLVVTLVAALEFLRGNCSVWCGIALLTTPLSRLISLELLWPPHTPREQRAHAA